MMTPGWDTLKGNKVRRHIIFLTEVHKKEINLSISPPFCLSTFLIDTQNKMATVISSFLSSLYFIASSLTKENKKSNLSTQRCRTSRVVTWVVVHTPKFGRRSRWPLLEWWQIGLARSLPVNRDQPLANKFWMQTNLADYNQSINQL